MSESGGQKNKNLIGLHLIKNKTGPIKTTAAAFLIPNDCWQRKRKRREKKEKRKLEERQQRKEIATNQTRKQKYNPKKELKSVEKS